MRREIWKPIADFEDYYEISNGGRVRSLSRDVEMPCRWGGTMVRRMKGRVLAQRKDKDGYVDYALCVGGETFHGKAHRLVASHFIRNPKGHVEINHLDLDKANNDVANLKWVSRKENQKHARLAGVFHAVTNPNRIKKLSPDDFEEIYQRHSAGETIARISLDFPAVARQTCWAVITRKRWQGASA